ncbi:MAG: hypothetical protein Q9169_004815 [Polycauliona sp. 2 TL-2023]
MAPKTIARSSMRRAPSRSSASIAPAAITPPRQTARPSVNLTAPRTPPGPFMTAVPHSSDSTITAPRTPFGPSESAVPHSSDSTITAESLRSATRSGRSYLPSDTGTPTRPASRRQGSAKAPGNIPTAPVKSTSRVEALSKALPPATEERRRLIGTPAPQSISDALPRTAASNGPVASLQQDSINKDVGIPNRHLASNNGIQQTISPATKPLTIAQNTIQPNKPQPAGRLDPATAITMPVRRTAMECETQWFLSLPHEERYADHHANPFAVPDDMEDWVREHLGSNSPSPPSPGEMGNRARWNMPPQPEHESFFAEAYEDIMQARDSSPTSHLDRDTMDTESESQSTEPETAMITAPFPENSIVPPRSDATFPITDS